MGARPRVAPRLVASRLPGQNPRSPKIDRAVSKIGASPSLFLKLGKLREREPNGRPPLAFTLTFLDKAGLSSASQGLAILTNCGTLAALLYKACLRRSGEWLSVFAHGLSRDDCATADPVVTETTNRISAIRFMD